VVFEQAQADAGLDEFSLDSGKEAPQVAVSYWLGLVSGSPVVGAKNFQAVGGS